MRKKLTFLKNGSRKPSYTMREKTLIKKYGSTPCNVKKCPISEEKYLIPFRCPDLKQVLLGLVFSNEIKLMDTSPWVG